MTRHLYIARVLTAVVSLCLLAVACSGSDDSRVPAVGQASRPTMTPFLSPSREPTTTGGAVTPSTSTAITPVISAPITGTDVSTSDAPEIATATPEIPTGSDLLSVVQQGFSQPNNSDEVGWAFLVENQNPDESVIGTGYEITIYDEHGAVLRASEGHIDFVMPESRLGVGGSVFVPQGTRAARMTVQVRPGLRSEPPLTPELAVNQVAYFPESLYPAVSGVVSSTFSRPLESIIVYAVGFNVADEIIGGGYAYVSFILPNQPAGVEVVISSAEQPSRIELYPAITAATVRADHDSEQSPSGALPVTITRQGWGQTFYEGEIGWGFLLHNPNTDVAAESVRYQVVAYDARGAVLATNAARLAMVLPGQTLGIGGTFFAPADTVPDHLDIQVLNQSFGAPTITSDMLTVENITFIPDSFSPKVTGIITNATEKDLEDVAVFAVAYDEHGDIIGGGSDSIDDISAHAQAMGEVAVAARGTPTTVEMYVTLGEVAPEQ